MATLSKKLWHNATSSMTVLTNGIIVTSVLIVGARAVKLNFVQEFYILEKERDKK